ncbi:hypothetical protein ABB37_03596 [Leptomonas pyrrhocoris]|uniref:Wings apart-like protein C-terminal domain-containing protein n=1 Tax=Leptomonas pyrrhocoris TaxID=157538 RepID=A0A0N0VG56_LEPPY|nr:hypothetical protein ABB37_03596 [Leptomonas pyrrhocoris]KPA82561.1 hypothetical protein ABB37_03596 [Leptomonas pyrrhocoris]|eukprot:XP_015661000.1 hypothetical protein ABB37_03596 [Leptomonas pyrrhocoris]
MSNKRRRCSLDILGGIDDLLGISAVSPLTSSACDDEQNASFSRDNEPRSSHKVDGEERFAGSSPVRKCLRACYSPASTPSSSTAPSVGTNTSVATTIDGLGGDEIDLLRRRDEEMADMALFLAKAIGEAPSQLSLSELVSFLEKVGVPRVLLALKRAEATEAFVDALFRAHPNQAQRVLLLRLLLEFLHFVEAEVFFQRGVIVFLVESLAPPDTSQPSASMPSSSLSAAVHWSARKKCVSPSVASVSGASSPSPTESCSDELDDRTQGLCLASSTDASSSATNATSALLSLKALLTLVFQHNRSLHLASPSAFSVSLSFAHAGGLERVGQLLLNENEREWTLSLLEVLTTTDVLRREGGRLLQLVPALVGLLSTVAQAAQVSVLKVITNITNLVPSALSETDTAQTFAEFIQRVLLQPSVDGDLDGRETFALCCAINVVKHEAKEGSAVQPTFTRAIMACAELLPALAESMTKRYRCSDAEQLVLSGYTALLLGALSLVDVGDAEISSLRVPVMTAVAAASRGTRIGKSTDRQPMRMVAAIIQEFLLFQSSSGTLTKEALVDTDFLVSRIRQHSRIVVANATESEASPSTAEDSGDMEVTLGDML